MAFTRFPDPTNNISNLANQPVEPPATLKQKFDQIGEDLKDWNNNTLLNELESIADGSSGLDNIGMTSISVDMTTPQQSLEYLFGRINANKPNLKIVSVLDYGAIGNGINNDYASIQSAVNYIDSLGGGVLFFPFGTYYIESSIVLTSNIIILGNGATIKSKTYSDVGKYTTKIFTAISESNIAIYNLNFDGNTGDTGYVNTADDTKISNLLYFEDVTNLFLSKCSFEKFLSNTNTARTEPYKSGLWAMMFVYNCSNVTMLDCSLTKSAIEGFYLFECENVIIDRMFSENTYMSTPLSVWFCNKVNIVNSKILEDVDRGSNAGSVINLYSKNVLVQGCYFEGGTAFDIGCEIEYPVIPFVASNVVIKNNYIKGSINSNYDDKQYQNQDYIQVVGNYIDATGFSYGIRVGNAKNGFIKDNTIIGAESGVRVFRDDFENMKILNNTFLEVVIGVNFTISLNTIKNVLVKDNYCETQDTVQTGTSGVFVLVGNASTTVGTEIFDNLIVESNKVKAKTAWLYVNFSDIVIPTLTNVSVIRNKFDALNSTGCLRGLSFRNTTGILIEENELRRMGANNVTISLSSNITIKNNSAIYDGLSANARVYFLTSSVTGSVECSGNICDVLTKNHLEGQAGIVVSPVKTDNNIPDTYVVITISHYGTTANRPTFEKPYNFFYYDTTINKPIWWQGTVWKDATGATV